VETLAAGSATTGELRELVTDLRQMIHGLEEREAAIQIELAARTEEANRLRVNLSAVKLMATSTRRRRLAGLGTADDRSSHGDPRAASPREDRSAEAPGDAADGERAVAIRQTVVDLHDDRDDLEAYWLGGLWSDLHPGPPVESGLDPREVASKFGAIARTLSREGVGSEVDEPTPNAVTSPAEEPKPTGRRGRARDRVPHEWSSRGPAWFYAFLGALATGAVHGDNRGYRDHAEPDSDGIHRAFGLGVLTVTEAGIARILVFGGGSNLVARFGLPPVHPGPGAEGPGT
jgi:hypothetical protein